MSQTVAQRADDEMRRYTRRGLARAILEAEQKGDEAYFQTHEIAREWRGTLSKKKLQYLASERNPTTSTGIKVFGSSGPKVMSNADRRRVGLPPDPHLRA